MRFRTLEIRWHDSKPIASCDFQHVPFKKARPNSDKGFTSQSYRLATGGEDNHVRIWMVHPNIMPPSLVGGASSSASAAAARPPRVEYLATLGRHSAAVNVVRFSPNGEFIASAGDDGMIIIWASSSTPQTSTYGSDLSPEDLQYEREYWRPRTTFRCTTMQVYDLAWSPTGEYIIAGSTDNCARVYTAVDGKCVHEIAEHTHYVQGVAWDPLNEYIATQSSDRSMHIYRIYTKQGGAFEAHAVGKNTRFPHLHTRTPRSRSQSKPKMFRAESTTSDAESTVSEQRDEAQAPSSTSTGGAGSNSSHNPSAAPLTPSTSVASTPSTSMFPPPPIDKPSSRRSSFSGSNAPGSPLHYGRFGRSPSPMPALPAIRPLPAAGAAAWASVKLYGDESFTNFFRRLTFSPDGGLLLTPAGQFEDPTAIVPNDSSRSSSSTNKGEEAPTGGRKGGLSIKINATPSANTASEAVSDPGSVSSVYIYSRANFARAPIAQLPGHKKASVAVKFSPILYELRPGVSVGNSGSGSEPMGVLERGVEGSLPVDVVGPLTSSDGAKPTIVAPAPMLPGSKITQSPALSPVELRPPTPATSKPPTPAQHGSGSSNSGSGPAVTATGSVFALPYRMLFAVETMDTVTIYDTQQSGPICMLTKLHYDEFTDMTWSPDGQCLMLSSRDGYCTIVVFDEILPAYHTQQQTLQLQSIAHYHSVPITFSTPTTTPSATPTLPSVSLPLAKKPRLEDEDDGKEIGVEGDEVADAKVKVEEPPKKKRRVALTRVGDVGS